MAERRTQLDTFAMALMVFLCAIWGFNQVAAKITNESISPLLQAGLRSTGSAVLLWIWCAARRIPLFGRDGSLKAGVLAGVLFAGEFAAIFYGLKYTTASRGVLFLYTSPFIVAAGLHWLVPAERLRLPQILGLICAFIGVFAAFFEGARSSAGSLQWVGDALLLVGAAMWGATTVIVRASVLIRIDAAKTLFYQLTVSAVILLPASLIAGEPGFTHPTLTGWSLLAWQIVAVSFASYLGWFWLIAHYPATRLAAFSFLSPLFGMIFGAVILSEPITPLLIVALVLVAAGLWLVNRRPRAAV
jgi:drug/metabolite transporter (DMT)-like permease